MLPKKQTEIVKVFTKLVEIFGNYISKCSCFSENMAYFLATIVDSNSSPRNLQTFLTQFKVITL